MSLALNDNKVIGCVHAVPQNVKVGDEIVLCIIGSDLVVHPEYRGRGITKYM